MPIILIAATNRLVAIDDAMIRRFELRIEIEAPNREQRLRYLRKNLGDRMQAHALKDKDFEELSRLTERYSYDDLRLMMKFAAKGATYEEKHKGGKTRIGAAVLRQHVDQSMMDHPPAFRVKGVEDEESGGNDMDVEREDESLGGYGDHRPQSSVNKRKHQESPMEHGSILMGNAGNSTAKRKQAPAKTWTCPHCEAMYAASTYLETHIMAKHKGEKAFPCRWCDHFSMTSSERRIHEYHNHPRGGGRVE